MSGRPKKPAAPRKKANGYKMPAPIPTGEVIHDTVMKKKWRIGPSIGVGGFGEIYSACDHDATAKKASNYPFVIKIEPHENGPLFVEKHFYVRNASQDEINKYMKEKKLSSLGMPTYFGNGSHEYSGEKYRYLVLERFNKDIWNIFKDNGRSFPTTTVFQLGLQMLDVLEYIHTRGYVHADIKGANILLGLRKGTENQAYLLDYGLATKINDKEFKPDPKCAHNGTIEYTSRDAHLGVSTMRGDLEILGYNMLQWIVGELPWEKSLKQPKTVQDMKEAFMKNVRANITKQFKNVPDALIKYFEYINSLKPKDVPNYTKCRQPLESYLKSEGKAKNGKLEFTTAAGKKSKTKPVSDKTQSEDEVPAKKSVKKTTKERSDNGDAAKAKRGRPPKVKDTNSYTENETPNGTESPKKVVRKKKLVKHERDLSTDDDVSPRKISRSNANSAKSPVPAIAKVKRTSRATPPVKSNHTNAGTQTSGDKRKRSPRQVSFDSPISEIINVDKGKNLKNSSVDSANSSGDLFDDSFTMEGKKKPSKKRLISTEEVTVKRTVSKKVIKSKDTKRSWRDQPAVVNGRTAI